MENSPTNVLLDQVCVLVCLIDCISCLTELANEIAEYLRRFILALYDEHIAPNGFVSTALKYY